jgi:hypothetical protein
MEEVETTLSLAGETKIRLINTRAGSDRVFGDEPKYRRW